MMNLLVKKPLLLHSLWTHPDSSYKLKVREMNLSLVKNSFFLSSLSYHQRQWRDIPVQTPELPEQGCDRTLQVVTSGPRRYHLRQMFSVQCTLVYSCTVQSLEKLSQTLQPDNSLLKNRSNLSYTMKIFLNYENIMPIVLNKILIHPQLTQLTFLVVSHISALQCS